MLYMPSIFGESLMDEMDDWMRDMDREFFGKKSPLYGHNAKHLMKTDVREHEDSYEVDIELPGLHKEDIQLSIENGYLNITAAKGLDREQTDKKSGKIIRQERYAGSCSRSFYIGNEVDPAAVTAKFENGILQISVPKASRQLPAKSTVEIK